MLITKLDLITKKLNTMDLPVTEEQLYRHAKGALAQDVFKHLTPDQREFLISGITSEVWKMLHGE